MNVDFLSNPQPLSFGSGESQFKLKLCRPTAADRSALLDAVDENSLAQIQCCIERMVVGWEGVCDLNGSPVDFNAKDGDTRSGLSRLGLFIGALPLIAQFEILAGVLEFMGVPSAGVQNIIANIKKNGGAGSLGEPARPTVSSDASGKTAASGT